MKHYVNRYPDEFKIRIVKEYMTTDVSRKELANKYGFGDGGTLNKWIRIFGGGISEKIEPQVLRAMSEERKTSKKADDQQARIKQLEQALAQEQLKTEALNTMIDIAEEQFNISIRKKAGSKR
ncbi:MAG: transposase [Bacteroidales bacterium]|nr:transposase [Bacteroidales bacterium]